jgi:hypothetical protein
MADDLNIGEGSEGTGYLLMGNYAWDNGFGLTLRYHGWDVETAAGVSADESTGFTFAPSYAVNDNLLLVAEYRTESVDAGGDRPATQSDYDQIALEALITF